MQVNPTELTNDKLLQTMHQYILIVGGYGVIGSRIAIDLAPDYSGRIVLGGRNLARANAYAADIGHGVRGCAIDLLDPQSIVAALNGVTTVVSCIDQPGRAVLLASMAAGLSYTDITPHLTELGRGAAYERIDAAPAALWVLTPPAVLLEHNPIPLEDRVAAEILTQRNNPINRHRV
jgi:NAD(P)-dependent dehydrogenase (short-subunit alcohol dehydrogenase family)